MLGDLVDQASALLQLRDPAALRQLQEALSGDWRSELPELLAADWHRQLLAAAALVLATSATDDPHPANALLWQAIDGASWVAPQLIACVFLLDVDFVARSEERLLGATRRAPKTLGALVRAYHRLPAPRLPVVAQLGRHDALLASEEARVGIRGVDQWLDGMPGQATPLVRSRWARLPR